MTIEVGTPLNYYRTCPKAMPRLLHEARRSLILNEAIAVHGALSATYSNVERFIMKAVCGI